MSRLSSRVATRSDQERQEDEAERLVRPAPKQKPPRHDRRRERVDTDTDDDPDEKQDRKDRSRNYKDVGGSLRDRVLIRWAKKKDVVPARSKETGKVVLISPKTLKEESGKYEPVEKGEDEEPPDEDGVERPEDSGEDRQETGEGGLTEGQRKHLEDELAAAQKAFTEWDDWETKNEILDKMNEDELGRMIQRAERPAEEGDEEEDSGARMVTIPGVGRFDAKTLREILQAEKPTSERPEEDPTGWTAEEWQEEHYSDRDVPEAGTPQVKPKEEAPKEEAPKKEAPKKEAPKKKAPSDKAQKVEKKLRSMGLGDDVIGEILALIQGEEPSTAPAKEKGKEEEKGKKEKGKKEEPEEIADEDVHDYVPRPKAPSQRSVAEKTGIPEPKRPDPSPQERKQALKILQDTFPEDLAANFMAADLHPQDATTLAETYTAISSAPVDGDLKSYAEKVRKNFQTDVDKVPLPKTWKKDGKEIPFEELDDAEKAEAYRQHQMETVALSLAAENQIAKHLNSQGLGKLSKLVAQGLTRPNANVEAMAEGAVGDLISSGTRSGIDSAKASRLKESLPKEAHPFIDAAVASDAYMDAKKELLENKDSPFFVTENDSPEDIATSIMRATRDIRKKTGGSDMGTADRLQEKVLARLQKLSPEKVGPVREAIDKESAHLYDLEVKKFEREQKKWEKQKDKHDKKQKAQVDKAKEEWEARQKKEKGGKGSYRTPAKPPEEFEEPETEEFGPPPKPPAKPPRYDAIRGKGKARAEEVLRRFQAGDFTYPPDRTMARTAVYYGVEPPAVEPYPGWSQVGQFDLTQADLDIILVAARGQMETPLHTQGTSGMPRDQWFRSALDLAIKETGYVVNAATYNKLLSKLTGAKDQSGGTLPGVVAGDSTFSPPQGTGDETMKKLSAEQSKAASKVLERMDQMGEYIQANYAGLGMNFDEAKKVVNALDKCADDFELASFGKESFEYRRQEVMAANKEAQVLQRDQDEPYMDTFNSPQGPHQTDSDEPYMNEYETDVTTEVEDGESETGQDLTPNYDD